MFPHAHGAIHQGWDSEPVSAEGLTSTVIDLAPGISAQSSDGGAREVIAGMVLPLLLAAMFVQRGRRLLHQEPLPFSRAPSPPTPPPRLVPAVG
jgi:hypothetical protein